MTDTNGNQVTGEMEREAIRGDMRRAASDEDYCLASLCALDLADSYMDSRVSTNRHREMAALAQAQVYATLAAAAATTEQS